MNSSDLGCLGIPASVKCPIFKCLSHNRQSYTGKFRMRYVCYQLNIMSIFYRLKLLIIRMLIVYNINNIVTMLLCIDAFRLSTMFN